MLGNVAASEIHTAGRRQQRWRLHVTVDPQHKLSLMLTSAAADLVPLAGGKDVVVVQHVAVGVAGDRALHKGGEQGWQGRCCTGSEGGPFPIPNPNCLEPWAL